MNINEYVQAAKRTNKISLEQYPETAIHHQMLGLIGEVGELAEKFKKYERDIAPLSNLNDKPSMSKYLRTKEFFIDRDTFIMKRNEIKKEFGDIFWYVCVLADMLEFDVDDILQLNIDKLAKRYSENKIGGSGDNR